MPDTDAQDLPGHDATLEAILAAAWSMLERGAALSAEDWHWPVLATIDPRVPERPQADARVVVLRRVDRAARELEFHSDLRAHKLAQLRDAPAACLVFFDRRRELQLRAWGDARAHTGDAVARRAWVRLGASSRRSYLAPRTPGLTTERPDTNRPDEPPARGADSAGVPTAGEPAGTPHPPDAQSGFEHFAAIVLRVWRIEWLQLARGGHQRARFEWPAARPGGIAQAADTPTPPDAGWIRP